MLQKKLLHSLNAHLLPEIYRLNPTSDISCCWLPKNIAVKKAEKNIVTNENLIVTIIKLGTLLGFACCQKVVFYPNGGVLFKTNTKH